MSLSLKKVISILLILLIMFFVFYESQNRILEKKLQSNEILLLKFKDFKDGEFEKKIEFNIELIESVLDTAMTYIGTPNEIGGTSYKSIDASGLVHISFKKNKILKFPRIAQEMARFGKIIINIRDLKRGDLVFFFDTYETENLITSVGIYLGENKFINSSTKNGVSISEINDPYYWKDKFFYGTRIFKK
tara:strand:- start:171 stop:740 length:570 start_codon:yes stop_codon:yes gene_type:complete